MLDLVLTLKCNNECVFCSGGTKEDMLRRDSEFKYGQIIRVIKDNMHKHNEICLTGGEPTILPFFGRLLRFLADNYPTKHLTVQTNGRLLGRYLEDIKYATSKMQIWFHINIPSSERSIFNDLSGSENAFSEISDSINLLNKEVGETFHWGAIIVITSKSIHTLSSTYLYVLDNKAKMITCTYPMFGYYSHDNELTQDLLLAIKDMTPFLGELEILHKEYSNVRFSYAGITPCTLHQSGITALDNVSVEHIIRHKMDIYHLNTGFVKKMNKSNTYCLSNECLSCAYVELCNHVYNHCYYKYGNAFGCLAQSKII